MNKEEQTIPSSLSPEHQEDPLQKTLLVCHIETYIAEKYLLFLSYRCQFVRKRILKAFFFVLFFNRGILWNILGRFVFLYNLCSSRFIITIKDKLLLFQNYYTI